MAVTTVHVYRAGSAVSGAKVMLSISGGGVTQAVRTDAQGKATVPHDGTGTATVFVNGSKQGTLRVPGATSVSI